MFLHTLRVIFTYAYRKPREKNWIIGILLFILVVFSNFTGYLLPWDQVSYWAITISVNLIEFIPLVGTNLKEILLGGATINDSTLVFFYSLHTGIIPILIILCMSYHFWYVRMAGGGVASEKDKNSKAVRVFPNLVVCEFIVALVLIAFLFTLSVFFDAPLYEDANPGSVPNPLKALLYFMGFQELLIHFHPLFAITILPVVIIAGSISLPYIAPNENYQGIWFLSQVEKKQQ
jgi:quinol-cytochrome oxidoreductase complex cytochrome b subunit